MKRSPIKKLFLKTSKYSQKNTSIVCCPSLILNKNAGLQSWNFIKKRLQHSFFPMNIAKFLRTSNLKNIYERLFERFPTWAINMTKNMGIEEDVFSKTKQQQQQQQ